VCVVRRLGVMVASCSVNVATVLVVALGLFAAAAPPGAHAAAAASPQLLAKLAHKEQAAMRLKERIEDEWGKRKWNSTSDCRAPDTCSSQAKNAFCSDQFGGTKDCDCTGRKISTAEYVVKATKLVVGSDDKAKEAVCYANELKKDFENLYTSMVETGDAKWIYYGSQDGVLINYPGFLWPRSEQGCGETYDPRIRPWMMSAATGPKNIIFILDKSGSMRANNRMSLLKDATKVVLNSMTHADYVGAVSFDSVAESYLGLTTLSKALGAFRSEISNWLDTLRDGGGTNFKTAYTKAFELVDSSKGKGYDAGCHTTYVFVTDGKADSPAELIKERQKTVKDEHHIIIALGDGTETSMLQELSCEINGIFSSVKDNLPYTQTQIALQEAMVGFYRLYALQKTLSKVEGVVWSEPYTSIPDIWGPVASASVPVYDKSKEPWHMVGVAAVDVPVCDLVDTAREASPAADSAAPDLPIKTTRGCTCVDEWTYSPKDEGTYSFQGCTKKDWAVPWCATEAGCGQCNTASVGPNNCWDDCKPTGPQAEVEEVLVSKSAAWCEPLATDPCQLEAIRGEGSKCGTCADPAAMANYLWAVDGTEPSFASGTWTEPGFEAATPGASFDTGDSSEGCGCLASMKPTCVCSYIEEAKKEAEEEEAAAAKEAGKAKSESATPVGAIIGGVAVPVLLAVGFGMFCRRKSMHTGQPHHNNPQQQMNAYPTHVQMAQHQQQQSNPYQPQMAQAYYPQAAQPISHQQPQGQQHYVAHVGAPTNPVIGQPATV